MYGSVWQSASTLAPADYKVHLPASWLIDQPGTELTCITMNKEQSLTCRNAVKATAVDDFDTLAFCLLMVCVNYVSDP